MKIITKIILPFLMMSLCFTSVSAQIDQAKINQQFYTAYITNSNPAWKITLSQLETANKNSLQLAKGYYAAAITALGNQEKDLVGDLLDKAAIMTKAILKENNKSPEANALLAAVYGLKIGLSPIKGPLLGSKSSSAAEKGVTLAPDNGFTNSVIGNNLYRTPSMFGGDIEKGITHLEKAKAIYEKTASPKNWEYMSLLALLGQVYHSQKQYTKAKAIYTAALEIAPNFGYVKMYLLPRTEKAIKDK